MAIFDIIYIIILAAIVLAARSTLMRVRREKVEVTSKKLQFNAYISLLNTKIAEEKKMLDDINRKERAAVEASRWKIKDDIRFLVNIHADMNIFLKQAHKSSINPENSDHWFDWNAYSRIANNNSRGRSLLEQKYRSLFGISIQDEDVRKIFQDGTPFSKN